MCKFKTDKITYSKRSLEQHDIRKKAFSDKPLSVSLNYLCKKSLNMKQVPKQATGGVLQKSCS